MPLSSPPCFTPALRAYAAIAAAHARQHDAVAVMLPLRFSPRCFTLRCITLPATCLRYAPLAIFVPSLYAIAGAILLMLDAAF